MLKPAYVLISYLDIPTSFKITCMSSWNTDNYLMTQQKCQQTTMYLKGAKESVSSERQRFFLLPTKLISSGSVIIEPVHWLRHSVRIFTSRPWQSYCQGQHPNRDVKYDRFILPSEKEKDRAHSTCCLGERHLHCWIVHKNCLYQKLIMCIPPVSWYSRDKLLLQPLHIPPIREHRHALGLHFPGLIVWLNHGTALKHQNYHFSTFCIKAKSAIPPQHKMLFSFLFFLLNLRTRSIWGECVCFWYCHG